MNPTLIRCCVPGCHATRGSDGEWPIIRLSDETLKGFRVSHGLCPVHYAEAIKQLNTEKEDLCKQS